MLGRSQHWPAGMHQVAALRTTAQGVGLPCTAYAHLVSNSHRRPLVLLRAANTFVVVESPAKAEKIQKFLGGDYKVVASYGHVRDLPAKNGSVVPDQNFHMLWEIKNGAHSRLQQMADGVRGAQKLVLATDPDREGEAISWHVAQEMMARKVLKGVTVERITFTEVTQAAVLAALQQPRQVSQELVDAYLARRALDYLVGFNISPMLWRKLPGAKSAGRVQSVALRLVCDREQEITSFKQQEFWSVAATAVDGSRERHPAELTRLGGKRLDKFALNSAELAQQAKQQIEASKFKVKEVTSKVVQRSPGPPFITSSLQQEASRKLGWGASRTMQAAQQLYEGAGAGEGLITYMRTDGVQLSPDAVAAIRQAILKQFGNDYVPEKPRFYKSKVKNAQEAHEAIRPTKPHLSPKDLPAGVTDDQRKLYDLIWRRAMACQMASAQIQQVGVDICSADGSITLRSGTSGVKFQGYLKAYDDIARSAEDPEPAPGEYTPTRDDARMQALLQLKPQSPVSVVDVKPEQHFTKPPRRYTEGTLVKALEERGIGRPSTYAPIMKLLQERDYVVKEGPSLRPSPLGQVLTAFLVRYFQQYVDYTFTSDLEEKLDDVSGGTANWRAVLDEFWGPFRSTIDGVTEVRVTDVVDFLDQELGPTFFPAREDGSDPRRCPACGGRLGFKPSRYGGFVGCSNYGDKGGCQYKVALEHVASAVAGVSVDEGEEGPAGITMEPGVKVLGNHPQTGEAISLRTGRFGAYIQLGTATAEQPKPRRASLPKKKEPNSVTLAEAVRLLELPREVGKHPSDNAPIMADAGRFGPYVAHGGVYASLPKGEAPQTVTLDTALQLLEAKREKMIAKGIDPVQAAEARRLKREAKSKGTRKAKAKPSDAAKEKKPKAFNAWIIYQQQQKPQLAEQHPQAKHAELVKLMAANWKAMDEAAREPYQHLAAAEASVDAKPTRVPKAKNEGKTQHHTAASNGADVDESTSSDNDVRPKPFRAKNAWQCFVQHRRSTLVSKGEKPGAVLKLLGEEWRALGEQGQAHWRSLASAEASNGTAELDEDGDSSIAPASPSSNGHHGTAPLGPVAASTNSSNGVGRLSVTTRSLDPGHPLNAGAEIVDGDEDSLALANSPLRAKRRTQRSMAVRSSM